MSKHWITEAELREIEERAEQASEGPWLTCCIGKNDPQFPPHVVRDLQPVGGQDIPAADEDAQFMAAARTDIPRLVAEVRALTTLIGHIHDRCCFECDYDSSRTETSQSDICDMIAELE